MSTTTTTPSTPKEIIESLLNGNLTHAQSEATFYATQTLVHEAQGMGYNYNDSLILSCYLKGAISFQDYADNFSNRF